MKKARGIEELKVVEVVCLGRQTILAGNFPVASTNSRSLYLYPWQFLTDNGVPAR
ncbi:MAG TPA: hypothetical protein VEP90_04180 [Methylomirabilota bacterium]|nr:hypothetical protein [Methylomirabilota bacterium]